MISAGCTHGGPTPCAICDRHLVGASLEVRAHARLIDENVVLEAENKRWRWLVEKLKRGDCWCEVGIGNPMVPGHSDVCIAVGVAMKAERLVLEPWRSEDARLLAEAERLGKP